jgi:serine/threonine protein kinase
MARYELVERIGVGGMAEIFRGKATAGGGFEKPVAIKRILPHLSQDKRFVELLISEAKTLSQLRHRNVVQIYDVGLGDDGQYFLVMEFVDGIDLGHLYESLEKRSRRLPLDVALYIIGEVCEALEHAHNARGEDGEPLGLVHRDVSPSNVLISRSGEVKLTDFGIAKRTEEATGHGGVRGKFAYISPEQAHNRRVDARSDVYSLGILLFEVVTGHRLFSDLPDFDALRAVREGRTPRPRDIDPSIDAELERILLTGLAPRPEDRFPSAGTLGAQLRNCRYTLVSSVADPAVEIARLIEEHAPATRQDQAPVPREPAVVRINTVAGFSGSFEVQDEPGGNDPTSQINELSQPLGLDDEEETRAVNLSSVERRLTSGASVDSLDLRGNNNRGPAPLSEADIADAETRILDYRPSDLFPELGAPQQVPVEQTASHEHSSGHDRSAAQGSSEDINRSAIRQPFYTGPMVDNGSRDQPPAVPILDAHLTAARRRMLILASGAAVFLAILSFVIAGAFMNGNGPGPAAQSSSPPPPRDAAPPVDAAPAPIQVAPQNVTPAPERPRRKKKKPKKRSAKSSSDKKRGAANRR